MGSIDEDTTLVPGSLGQGSGRPRSRWVYQSWLENIELSFYPPCLNLRDDLRLRAILKHEKEEFRRSNPYDLKILGGSPACVIETAKDLTALPGDTEGIGVILEQESLLAALLLYRDRLVTRHSTLWKEGDFVNLDERQEYAPSSVEPLWRIFVARHHRFPLELASEDKDEFRSFWAKLERSEKKVPQLSMCLGRFASASGMVTEAGMDVYRVVDYVTSMEALLTEGSGASSFKLALRMAMLLGESGPRTNVVFEFMRLCYRVRSKLVHGEEPPPMELQNVEIRPGEALGRLHSYCHECIRHSLDLVDAGFEKKKLLHVIDLAVLRTDMRTSLWSFLKGKQSAEKLNDDFGRFDKLVFHPILHEERNGALE